MTAASGALLRIPGGRVRLWVVALVVLGLVPVISAPFNGWNDWPAFWSAGAMAGTPALGTLGGQIAWQEAHGVAVAFFPYPPAAALALVPFAWLPLPVAFCLFTALMGASLLAAGVLAGRLGGVGERAGIAIVLAWAPATASLTLGQNAPLLLLLALAAITGLAAAERGGGRGADRRADLLADLLAGIAAGLACYKPTAGLPLVGLLVLRRRWLSVAVAGLVALAGYLLSALAVGGALDWPNDWLAGIRTYMDLDFAANADKAVSVPGLLQRAGLGSLPALAAGGLLVVAFIPALVRLPAAEAGALACLAGVAASPHAWGYDAALLAPFLVVALGSPARWLPPEPWRTRVVVAVFGLGLLWIASKLTVLSGVAVAMLVVLALALPAALSASRVRSAPRT